MALLHSITHLAMRVRQHAQYQDPETELASWHAAVINYIMYTCALL